MTEEEHAGLSARERRRQLVGPLLRSGASVFLLTALYYLCPLNRGVGATAAALALGLALFGCLVAWQIVAITRAEHPRLRAIEALSTAVPLFLLLFSAAYFLISMDRPESFSELLNRTDALYFTVTVFATVGFGDITPTSEGTRILTTVQMLADLILVGIIAKVLFSAVRIGLRRRENVPEPPEDQP